MDLFYYTTSPDSDAAGRTGRAALPETTKEGAGSSPAHDAREMALLRETPIWQQALEHAGFTQAEASRLIFERVRPRAEGATRS